MELPTVMHNENKKDRRVQIKIDAQNISEKTLREMYEILVKGGEKKREEWSYEDFLNQITSTGKVGVHDPEEYEIGEIPPKS